MPQVRVARQQTQRDHHVRLAAAHGLGQLEDRLIRLAGQPQQAFAEQLRHAMGDEVAREELTPVAGVVNEVGQVLDALAHPVVVDGRVEAAGLLDGLNHEVAPLAARLLLPVSPVAMPLILQCSRISTSTMLAMERCSSSAARCSASLISGSMRSVRVAVLLAAMASSWR